jgi:arylsulfatase A-like enzyme/tetratricopeptide (TPR) repeat protein
VSRSLRIILGSAVLVLVVAAAVWWQKPAVPPSPGLVLITIDTLRADRVGAYGSQTVKTPALDSVAAHGMRFSAAYAVVPLTLPSHVSMLSGRLAVAHTVRTNDGYRVPESVPLVAEALHRAGYRTAAFVGSAVLKSSTGLGRGFDRFDDDMGQAAERRGGEVVRRATEWLATIGTNRYFLWVHLNDPHLPYDAPEPFATEYKGHSYEAEVAYADYCVGLLLREMDRLGVSDRTTVIVAADHGEGLGDHGERSHGLLLYDSTIRVPLLIRPAGGTTASTITRAVSTAQIAPTLLAFAHLPNPEALPELTRPAGDSDLVSAETLYAAQQLGWSPMYAARSGPLKVIDAPTLELYDLDHDPQERRNLAVVDPGAAQRLRDRLRREIQAAAQHAIPPSAVAVDANASRQLSALGYVSGSGSIAAGAVPVGGVDPHARIDIWEQDEHGLELSSRGDHTGAAAVFELALRSDPGNVLALKFLGAAALERGDLPHAIDYNERVVASGLHQPDALSNLALAYYRAGRLDAALGSARRALRADVQHPAARANLMLILETIGSTKARAGDDAGAIAAFREASSVEPSNLDVAERLAAVLHRAGSIDEARTLFESVVSRAPDRLAPQLSLGILDLETGHVREAARRLEKIRPEWPESFRVQYYLGESYRQLGDSARAREAYARCLSMAPAGDSVIPAARQALATMK